MIETLIVVFREGLEAFLVVAIMLAYLGNTGRESLKTPVYIGIVVALVICALTWWRVAELADNPVWEASLAILAGLLVASFTIYVMRTAKNIRSNIDQQLEKSVNKGGMLTFIGLFIFTVLMVSREGMETALMLGTISAQKNADQMMVGAGLALVLVAFIGFMWVKQSSKINLRLFLQVTGVFLILFSFYLFFYGMHELSEMMAIPFIGETANINFHTASEIIETPLVGGVISLALIGLPILWIGISWLKGRKLLAK
jgi:high-affinity iron transporter